MAHYCICAICNQKFDRDKIQAVRHNGKRYSHASCEPDNKDFIPMPPSKEESQEDKDLKALKDYIGKIYGDKANWPLITKQIKTFTKDKKYSLSGILKSLVWFYDVKGNKPDKSNYGIGIVDYCYKDAYNYYLALFIAQEASKDKTLNNEIKEITIAPPEMRGTKQKLIDFGEWLNDEQ